MGARNLGECLRLQLQCAVAGHAICRTSAKCWKWVCAFASSPWSCWRGVTSNAWCSFGVWQRCAGARGHHPHCPAGAQAGPALCRCGAQYRGTRRAGGAGRQNPAGGMGPKFRVQLNPDVMPRLKVHDIYANVLRNHKAKTPQPRRPCSSACRRRAGSSRISSSALTPFCASAPPLWSGKRASFVHGELAMRPLVLREIADELGCTNPPSAASPRPSTCPRRLAPLS